VLINLFLTLRCNLNCDYCYAESASHATQMPLTTALDSTKFILDVARKESAITLGIGFLGGEPLLCINTIKQVTSYIADQRDEFNFPISYILTINGTLINPEIVDFFRSSGFQVSFSIDGPKLVHDKHRRYYDGRGSFEDAHKGIILAIESLPDVVARITFTPKTVENLEESVRYIADMGFNLIKVSPDFFDKTWALEHVYQCEKQFEQILNWLPTYLDLGRAIRIGPIEQRLNLQPKSVCNAGLNKSQFSIGPSGEIYPCSYQVGNPAYVIGDIYSGIIYEQAQKVHCTNERPFTRSACRGCALFSSCDSGRCTFLNLRMTGRMDIPSPFYCSYEKMMYRIVQEYKARGLSSHPTYTTI